MIKLNLQCESVEEARVYLNAPQYHNLISDMYAAIYSAKKHGTDSDILCAVETFYNDLHTAVNNSEGPY